ASLTEIVAANGFIQVASVSADRGNAGPAFRRADTLGFDESTEDRERQVCMPRLDALIEPIGKLALARQRAIPFALVIGEAPNVPERQFQIDQRQRRVGPGAGGDQLRDPRGFLALAQGGEAPAGRANHLGDYASVRFASVSEQARDVAKFVFS